MNNRNLTPQSWLDLALKELKEHGYTALKAQPLAKKLNVSRGSFYHHFDSLEDFHSAIINYWAKSSSGNIIDRADKAPDPNAALLELLQITLKSGEKLERAMRSWATVDKNVASEVEQVDLERIQVAKRLLIRCGLEQEHAATRAKILYWAAIGRLMMPFPNANILSETEIFNITNLMLTKP